MDRKNDPVFKKESRKLADTVDLVSKKRNALEKSLEELSSFNINQLKEMRENPITNAADYAQFMNMLRNKNVAFNVMDKYKRLEELEYLTGEPYFARIDLADKVDDKISKRYIGKFGFVDDQDNPLILDWRAKAATVFYKYRYPQENVEYETPEGKVTKDLLLKRTFEIDEGELVKYFNNDIQLDETEIIIDKIEGRTGGVLEDIIETIQESQHEIITSDPRRVTIVQGTVGSGKSTVAIHKLSYIFFNYPEIITPERSILIARNQILVGYLSTLFPKLGIFDINYGTIRDVVYNLIFKEKLDVDFDLSKNTQMEDFDLEDLNGLLEKLSDVHQDYKNQIDKIFDKKENEPFGGFVYDSTISVQQNISEITRDLAKEIKYQKDFVKENPNHSRAELFKENIKIMRKIVTKLNKIKREIKSKTLKKLIKEYKLLHNNKLGYRDALIYLIIYDELFGYKEYKKFEYCVVDEGQDFNVLEYYVLSKLVQNGRFCILGDLNQSYKDFGLTSWENIYEIVSGAKEPQEFTLETNYRSTKPIVDLANSILEPYTDKYLPESINRKGKKPKIVKQSENNDVAGEFEKELKKDIKNLEKSIGIICMDPKFYDISKEIIENANIDPADFIELKPQEKAAYLPRAVYLSDFDNIKGLEFGKVYVLGLNLDKINSFKEAKKAFVAVTRAMDELSIYSM